MINSFDIEKFIREISFVKLDNTKECKEKIYRLVADFINKRVYWLHHPLKAGTTISRCRKNPESITS